MRKIKKMVDFFENGVGSVFEKLATVLLFPTVILMLIGKSNFTVSLLFDFLIFFILLAIFCRTLLKEFYYDDFIDKMIKNGADVYFKKEKIDDVDLIYSLKESHSYSFNEDENKIWFE